MKNKLKKVVQFSRQENMIRLTMAMAYGKRVTPCPTCNYHKNLDRRGMSRHERGCPNSHLYSTRQCKRCGVKFNPDTMDHTFCSKKCERKSKKKGKK